MRVPSPVSWMEKVAEFKLELRATGGRPPRYPVMVLVAIERVVLDDSEPTGLRVYAWAKLVKVWASLRWSDLQGIRPGELKLVEGRWVTTLRRTKTSGPNRRIKEMPLCVSEAAFFENPAWLKIGFELLQWLATFGRDCLLPKLKPNFAVFEKKMAEYADVVAVLAAILQRAGIPAERSVLPTGLSVLKVTAPEKHLLQRWKPEGSDTYARSYGGRVAGPPLPSGQRWPRSWRRLGGLVPSRASSESLEAATKMPRSEDRRSKYVVVELPGAIFRLRKSGASGCWMGRRREFRNCQKFSGLPDKSEYTHVCRLCWPSGEERGRTRLAIPPQPYREMGRRQSWDPAIRAGISGKSGGQSGSGKASFAGRSPIVHFDFPFQKQGLPRKARYVSGYLAAITGDRGREKKTTREERRERTCCLLQSCLLLAGQATANLAGSALVCLRYSIRTWLLAI